MLRLAAIDVFAILVFGAIYTAGAVRLLSQAAFLAALALGFAGAIALWVRTERAPVRTADPIARLGRGIAGLLLAVIGVPGAVLTPLFALQAQLPPEAGLDDVIARVMVLLLPCVALAVAMNLVGACVIAATALVGRRRVAAPRGG